ncbi:MAG: response regulator [Candidatus Aminicenantes bacterium]|nr:response regulator [Candidatus Aminicenantes bacterium]MDH5383466.1 response regulator [Candidatus Aminicenantes bacterium]MDH5742131.1 response regulator [Candidatus Aminicenantes bacterium]
MIEKTKRKILVVDDEINVCKSICQAIESEEYEVDMALSGEEALKKDKEKPYDLIITDLMMPGISGMDLLTSLKTARPGVNVIIITGYPTIKTAVQSIKIGAFDYLPKPFTPNDLRSLVSRAFKSAEIEKEKPVLPDMPEDLFVMRGHTWARKEGKNLVTIGILPEFLQSIISIVDLELLMENKSIFQGEVCARITDNEESVHRVWSPVTGRIAQANEKLKENLTFLKTDPYGKGWLLRIESPDIDKDLECLSPSKE